MVRSTSDLLDSLKSLIATHVSPVSLISRGDRGAQRSCKIMPDYGRNIPERLLCHTMETILITSSNQAGVYMLLPAPLLRTLDHALSEDFQAMMAIASTVTAGRADGCNTRPADH